MFTGNSTVLDVKNELLLKDEFDLLFSGAQAVPDGTRLQDIGHMGGADEIKSVHGGLNALMHAKSKGIMPIRPLWSKEEVKEAPEREHTVLHFFPAAQKAPFALICPGGGYSCVVSVTEGFPVAAALNSYGISAFVLTYRIGEAARYPAPQEDVAKAISHIMDHAEHYNVMRENYSVFGFSAGGHLAASFGTQNMGYARYALPSPSALILSYPVITMGDYAHRGSRDNLLGPAPTDEAILAASVEKQLTRHYPPTYLWSCAQDALVPFENSRLMKEGLSMAGVHHRLQIVPGDGHGWSLGNTTAAEGWIVKAIAFWRSCMM